MARRSQHVEEGDAERSEAKSSELSSLGDPLGLMSWVDVTMYIHRELR